jgi:hypothetical protein
MIIEDMEDYEIGTLEYALNNEKLLRTAYEASVENNNWDNVFRLVADPMFISNYDAEKNDFYVRDEMLAIICDIVRLTKHERILFHLNVNWDDLKKDQKEKVMETIGEIRHNISDEQALYYINELYAMYQSEND